MSIVANGRPSQLLHTVLELELEQISNEITIIMKITNKNYNYGNNYNIFLVTDYISVYADHAMDKKNRLLIDHTSHNWSSIVDIYALIFGWSQTTVPIG